MRRNFLTASVFAGLVFAALCFAGCSQLTDSNNKVDGSGRANANANTPAGNASSDVTSASAVNSQPAHDSGIPVNTAARPANTRDQKMPQPQVGSGGNDLFLFTQARAAVNGDDELKNAAITIDVKEGVATLNGTVASDAQKQKAERLVKGVQGVKSVNDRLRVAAVGSK